MLKKVLFAALATALVAAVALPMELTSAGAAVLTCKEAAKLKFPTDHKARQCLEEGLRGSLEGHPEGLKADRAGYPATIAKKGP
jgi:hypothetical protein